MTILNNKLGVTDQAELNRMEEKISKQKVKQLFDSGNIYSIEAGTFRGLSKLHQYLFEDIYEFAGMVRDVDIAKKGFRFAPVMYLKRSLDYIDKMPQRSFDEIIEKYVEMNVAHPFREGNGRSTRIWLDLMLKSGIERVIDWNLTDKEDYLIAMERSPVKDFEIKHILKEALTDKVDDRKTFMNGINASYYYEGLSEYNIEDL
nr:Fic family protein [Oceanobacillus sojae]